jgi:hypothetical protein
MIRRFLLKNIKNSLIKEDLLKKTIKHKVISSAGDRDYFITTDILKYVLQEKIKYHIMERSHYMNYIPRQNVETNKVKLFGNNNYFVDSSKWVSIDMETRVNDTLEFSFSDKFLVINSIFKHFKINIEEDEIVSLLEHNQIDKIDDIFCILAEFMIERSI